MKKTLILIMSLHFAFILQAQTILSGHVTDKTNSQPIVGVNVYIAELNKGAITDENGYYKLELLPEGHFHVQFSFIGYSTYVEHIFLTKEPRELNIALDEMVIQSQEVVVSGGSYMSQHENAIKIEAINAHEINELNNVSFIESLSSVPGVDVISKGPGVSTPVIRGLSLSNILMLNNGIRLENFQFSENHPFMVDEFGIEKVEIIKGPASLLYGSDAIGGVINVVSERSANEGKISGDANFVYHTNTNGLQGNLGLKAAKNSFFYGIRAGVKSHEDYTDGNGVQVPNSRFNEASVKLNGGIVKSFGKSTLFYDFNRMKLGLTMDASVPLIEGNSRTNEYWFQDLTNHLITLKNTAFVNQFRIDLNLSYQLNNRKLQESIVPPVATDVHMQLNTFFYELKVYLPTGENLDLILGMQGDNKHNENKNAPTHILPNYTSNNFSVYGLYQQNFTKHIHFQAGARYDLNNIYAPEQKKTAHSHETSPTVPVQEELMPELTLDYANFSGSVGGTVEFNEHLLLRVNYASAYRTPNIAELTQEGMHGNRYEMGDRLLNSQRSHEVDLSLHAHYKLITFDLAGFYNQVNDFIYLTPTTDTISDGDQIYRYVQSNAHLYGFETGMSIKPLDFFQFRLSYAYLVGEKTNGEALPFIPQNKINGGIVLKYNDLRAFKEINFSVTSTYAFKQNNPALFETKTDDYFVLNASFGCTFMVFKQDVEIGINAHNIMDIKYFDHLSTLKTMGYYNMGRNISFSLKVPFEIR